MGTFTLHIHSFHHHIYDPDLVLTIFVRLLYSQVQETATFSRQATAHPREPAPGSRRSRGAGAQDPTAAPVYQSARVYRRISRGQRGGAAEAGGVEEGDAQGEESQDQGVQLPEIYVDLRSLGASTAVSSQSARSGKGATCMDGHIVDLRILQIWRRPHAVHNHI